MPTPPAERPLRKVTIRIFEEDYEWYKENYGTGLNDQIRELLRNWRETVEARR